LERERRTVSVSSTAGRRRRSTIWIAAVGALAYNSWPLAFAVNPSLGGSALASSFESHGQPFSWLFILLDCIAGSCMGLVCIRELRPNRRLAFALLGYGVFGIATAVDAVVPLDCGSASAQACASQIWPPTPDDLLTGIAVLGLFTAAVTLIVRMIKSPTAFPAHLPPILIITLISWNAVGLAVLMWNTSATMAAAFQYAFLTLSSVLAFIVPLGATALQHASTTSKPMPQNPGFRR
jgi:hypothetical protein